MHQTLLKDFITCAMKSVHKLAGCRNSQEKDIPVHPEPSLKLEAVTN